MSSLPSLKILRISLRIACSPNSKNFLSGTSLIAGTDFQCEYRFSRASLTLISAVIGAHPS
ncbi:MAG: hypothetical protein ACXAD7_05815 [Candidatus Kariarchaeaceae archaeon]